MPGIVPVGQTQYIGVSSTPNSVTYGPNISNTFRFVNESPTSTLYVAVYNDATLASNFVKPTAGTPVPGVVAILQVGKRTSVVTSVHRTHKQFIAVL